MDKILIHGGKKLNGEVSISGSKNATLPIMAATLLTEDKFIIKNVPDLRDVRTMILILEELGVKVQFQDHTLEIDTSSYSGYQAPYELVCTMRASISILGPLLAKKGKAKVALPGGCVIGTRPIDLHLKGLRALGADIKIDHGYIDAHVDNLEGKRIYLGGPFGSSVLATANVMLAATLAEGTTVIESAACEPEIKDLAEFLRKMGAVIKGAGTPEIEIKGVKELHGTEHEVIADRIEAGTFMIAAAITAGKVTIKGCQPHHLGAIIDKLIESGSQVTIDDDKIAVERKGEVKSLEVTTLPYPGFPTDMQAQIMALMTVADGISIITEKVFPERFMHVGELNRMGAQIYLEGPNAIVKGVSSLSGAEVMASDLRASAALLLAGLIAQGETLISRIYHLDRGYEKIEEKFKKLGAIIKRIK